MRRSIPLSVRFRRFRQRDRTRSAGRTRILCFAGRLLAVNRVLTNAVVLAVVPAALVWIVVGIMPVRFNKPLITIVLGVWLSYWGARSSLENRPAEETTELLSETSLRVPVKDGVLQFNDW